MKQSRGPMAGKTVLVTGGSGGIGRATALGLAEMGAHLAITGRDHARTEAAAREIRAVCRGPVDAFVADLSSQAQVRRLAQQALQSLSRIDVLVNNVGGYWNTRHVTADGLERTFAVNHLAPFLLTNLLFDRLARSIPARVVTVSSNAQANGRIEFGDLQGERSYSGARAYDQSKLANVLFTYELARRLQATPVTANALHPGVVSTSFGAEDPGFVQRLLVPFIRPFMKPPGPGCRHVDPLGFRSRARAGNGTLLRQRQAKEILEAQLRQGCCGPALAGEHRSGRPDLGRTDGQPRYARHPTAQPGTELIPRNQLDHLVSVEIHAQGRRSTTHPAPRGTSLPADARPPAGRTHGAP